MVLTIRIAVLAWGLAFPALAAAGEVGCTTAPAHPYPESRRALVIGNMPYDKAVLADATDQAFGAIPTADNDASDMQSALCGLGFDAQLLLNADAKQVRDALTAFAKGNTTDGVRIFYYSGHGIALKDENYIIPVDATSETLESKAISFADIYDALSKDADGNTHDVLKLFLFDACRTIDSSLPGGLALPAQAPQNTVFGFATAPERVAGAPDDSGKHSYYTEGLLGNIRRPAQTLTDLFDNTRADVWKTTAQEQLTWESTSAFRNFYFEPPPSVKWQINWADDMVAIVVNNVVVSATAANVRTSWTGIRAEILHPGANPFSVLVYNQKTRTRGFLEPEGWHYDIDVALGDAQPKKMCDKEDNPPPDHWGNIFVAGTGEIFLDPKTGLLSLTKTPGIQGPCP